MHIILIQDDKPGHYHQSEAIIEALKQLFDQVTIEVIDIKRRTKLSRTILRFMLNHFSYFFKDAYTLKFLPFFYRTIALPKQRPDLIVSTGGDTANLNAWFALYYGSYNLYNGGPRGLHAELFTYVTTVLDLGVDNQIILDIAPTTIALAQKNKRLLDHFQLSTDKPCYVLLIGGDGSGYRYDRYDIDALIAGVNYLHQLHQAQWLVTTSRRTNKVFEAHMKQKMEAHYFVDFHRNPQKVVGDFLQLADVVFVTEESASMVSEAIASGKPVVTLSPRKVRTDSNYQAILRKYIQKNYIMAYPIATLDTIDTIDAMDAWQFDVRTISSIQELRIKLGKVFMAKENDL